MKQYIKKPIPVWALQWTGVNILEINDFCKNSEGVLMCFLNKKNLWIETREGHLKATIGDYIIRGIEGEFYPCDERVFKKSYDEFYAIN